MMNGNMTRYVLASIGLAIVAGLALRTGLGADSEAAKNAVAMLHLPAEIFLHLIKMIIAPLVFSTLVYGIAHTGDSSGLGRADVITLRRCRKAAHRLSSIERGRRVGAGSADSGLFIARLLK